MCIVRDNRRDGRFCELHDVGAAELCLRVSGASGSMTVELPGEEEMTPDDMDADKGLSHGIFCCCLLR